MAFDRAGQAVAGRRHRAGPEPGRPGEGAGPDAAISPRLLWSSGSGTGFLSRRRHATTTGRRARKGTWCSGTSTASVAVARFEIPSGATATCLALRRDGSSVAGCIESADGRRPVLVWDVASRRLRHQFAARATALAYSDDGELLASGDEDGRINVWKLPEGQQIAAFSQGRNTIECFSLTRNPQRNTDGKQGWLLAAGDSGGSIVVWDLIDRASDFAMSRRRLQRERRRVFPRRCDPGFGRPDGHHVPLGLGQRPESPESQVWLPQVGPGFHSSMANGWRWGSTFRTTPVILRSGFGSWTRARDPDAARADRTRAVGALAPDGRKLAALSQDWRLAIWDLPEGRLDAILNAPKGYSADNAAMAFSGDGRQFAACSGREAKLWDVESGKVLRSFVASAGSR